MIWVTGFLSVHCWSRFIFATWRQANIWEFLSIIPDDEFYLFLPPMFLFKLNIRHIFLTDLFSFSSCSFFVSLFNRHPSSYSCVRINFLRSTRDAVIEKLTSILNGTSFTSSSDLIRMGRNCATAEVDHETQSPSSNGSPRDGDIFKKHLSIDKCQLPGLDYVFFVRGSGPHVMQCGDVLVQPLKEVIVSRKCAEAVLRGAQVWAGASFKLMHVKLFLLFLITENIYCTVD